MRRLAALAVLHASYAASDALWAAADVTGFGIGAAELARDGLNSAGHAALDAGCALLERIERAEHQPFEIVDLHVRGAP